MTALHRSLSNKEHILTSVGKALASNVSLLQFPCNLFTDYTEIFMQAECRCR
jgi:hypothetical protein